MTGSVSGPFAGESGTDVSVIARGVTACLSSGTRKQILNNVDFHARPGEMTAIMGSSGCGKTTFLNVLANRAGNSFQVDGTVYYGGNPNLLSHVNEFSGYVMQEDYMLEYLTVQETLVFAARLRLAKLQRQEQIDRVNRVMEDLSLNDCRSVLVGGRTVKGVSGGQRKRVSIAIALLNEPAVLYLDEPTSGLDASLSFDVMRTVQRIARNGNRTIVCTIHQPRSQVFSLFDRLLLLRQGQVVYQGLVSNSGDYFKSIGHECPPSFNIADYFLDLITTDTGNDSHTPPELSGTEQRSGLTHKGSAQRIVVTNEQADRLIEEYKGSHLHKENETAASAALANGVKFEISDTSSSGLNWFTATYILALRGLKQASRQPAFVYVSTATALFMTVIIGTIWLKSEFPDTDPEQPCDITVGRNLLGGVMQMVGNIGFSCFDAGAFLCNRRPLINRESAGGLYPRSAAITAAYISDGVLHYWPSMGLALILYFMMWLKMDANAFFCWILFAWLLKFTYWGYSTMCGAIGPNVQAASGLVPLGAVLLFLTSGFQLSDAEIPGWLVWLKSISPTRYALQGIGRTQLGDEYAERCLTFQTPSGWGNSFGLTLLVGLGFRLLSVVFFQFLHTKQGVQA